jgi:hypothetical protein
VHFLVAIWTLDHTKNIENENKLSIRLGVDMRSGKCGCDIMLYVASFLVSQFRQILPTTTMSSNKGELVNAISMGKKRLPPISNLKTHIDSLLVMPMSIMMTLAHWMSITLLERKLRYS